MHETKINYFHIKNLIKKIKKNKRKDAIPIYAIVTHNQKIISEGQNTTTLLHAEIIALDNALKFKKEEIIKNAILYTSLEPCLMCVGAAINAGIKTIYYGCRSPESGIHTKHNYKLLEEINVIPILKYEKTYKKLLVSFFQKKRIKNNYK